MRAWRSEERGCEPVATAPPPTYRHRPLSTQPAPPHPTPTRTLPTRASAEDSPTRFMTTDIQNLKTFDPFAEAEDSVGETKTTSQNYIHIRIQRESPPFVSSLYESVPLCCACCPL